MTAFQNIIIYSFGTMIFYGFIIWFFHKANTYFKKLDKAIGNKETSKFHYDNSVNKTAGKNIRLTNDDDELKIFKKSKNIYEARKVNQQIHYSLL